MPRIAGVPFSSCPAGGTHGRQVYFDTCRNRMRGAVGKIGPYSYSYSSSYSNVTLCGELFARMELVVLEFEGGGEWSSSEIDRVVTRHPRTLVVHVSCA